MPSPAQNVVAFPKPYAMPCAQSSSSSFGGAARVLGFARGGGRFGPVGGHHSAATYGRDVAYRSKASYKSSECQLPILDT